MQINCSANASLSESSLSPMASEKYVKGMQEMRTHFGDAADNWIKAIHDI